MRWLGTAWRTRIFTGAAVAGLILAGVLGAETSPTTHCPEGEPSACIRSTANDLEQQFEDLRCDHDSSFVLLYLRVTEAILGAVDDRDVFEHNGYIADMDVLFADYYLNAFEEWHDGSAPPPAWEVALEAAEEQEVAGLGNMVLGLNAHIRNDLPFVVEQLGTTRDGESVKNSFDRVDEVLRDVYVPAREEAADRLSPTIDDTDLTDTSVEEDSLFEFVASLRQEAWEHGELLLGASTEMERDAVAQEIRANAYQSALDYRALFDYHARNYSAEQRNAYCESHFGDG